MSDFSQIYFLNASCEMKYNFHLIDYVKKVWKENKFENLEIEVKINGSNIFYFSFIMQKIVVSCLLKLDCEKGTHETVHVL